MESAIVTKAVDFNNYVKSVGNPENYYRQVLIVSSYQRAFGKSLINKTMETTE